MDQSLLELKQWLLEELERKLTLQIGETKQVRGQYNSTWLCTGTCSIASPIFLSEINFDIFNIRLGLKQKSGNWKMATLKLSSQLLQTSIMALVFLSLISISAVNDFLCVFL